MRTIMNNTVRQMMAISIQRPSHGMKESPLIILFTPFQVPPSYILKQFLCQKSYDFSIASDILHIE